MVVKSKSLGCTQSCEIGWSAIWILRENPTFSTRSPTFWQTSQSLAKRVLTVLCMDQLAALDQGFLCLFCWHFCLNNYSLWGSVLCIVGCLVASLCPLAAHRTPPLVTMKNVSEHCHMSHGGKINCSLSGDIVRFWFSHLTETWKSPCLFVPGDAIAAGS